jgi:hypothetical protein
MKKIQRSLEVLAMMAMILGSIILWGPEVRAEENPSLAVFPFLIARGEDPGRGSICPICKEVHRRGDVVPGSENILSRILQQKMEALGTFKVLPAAKVEEVLSHRERKVFEEKPISSAIDCGRELNADFVMVGFLFRFEERIGSSMGVEKPASVGLDLHLYRLRDGKEVWKGKFDETQRPLSENLLKIGAFFRRKASWLPAKELASVGMDELFVRLPSPKELEEQR